MPYVLGLMGMSVPIIIIGLVAYFSHQSREMLHRERMAALERGLPPPDEPPRNSGPQVSSRDYLLRGLVWLFVGLGLLAFWWTSALYGHPFGTLALLGFVPVGVGIAHIVFYTVENLNARPPMA
jgi:hypothetical protein